MGSVLRRAVVRWFVACLAVSGLVVAAPDASGQEPFAGTVTGAECDSDSSPRFCTGFLAGIDGTALDVDLALPAAEPYPLIVVVHGWGGSKGSGEPSASYPGDDFLTARGYAVMRYSARGFGKSWGQTHLASLRVEIRDLQSLVSALVDDDRFAVIPNRVGVTGASYGGGHSWLIAARSRWTTPEGTRVRVAAVAPVVPWTDLVYSLLPNGRPSRSTEVVGTMKLTYVNALFAGGIRHDPERPYPNYISLLPELYTRFSAGEPYEAGGVRDPIVQEGERQLTTLRSVAWQHRWLQRLRADRSLWVPVLDVQGWTDDLFPAAESLRMYRLLKRVSPEYPIKLYFGDIGHPRAANKPAETQMALGMVADWFDYWLKGKGVRPSFDVTAATTTPGQRFARSLLIRAARPEGLTTDVVRLTADGPFLLANQPGQTGGIPADPIVDVAAGSLVDPLASRLVEAQGLPTGGSLIAWRVERISGGSRWMWYVGEGRVRLRGTVAGTDVQYDVRLWDRAPDGSVRLVDRGTFKFLGAPGTFDVRIPLFGNAWRFGADHELLLEVANVDAPFLRPNNLPSSTVVSSVSLRLPVRG
jgi:ABC-2 type transport system ATP-binding protein